MRGKKVQKLNIFFLRQLFLPFRWQQEITETVFESVNQEADRLEKKNKAKKLARFYDDEKESDCILQGYIKKRGQSFASGWQVRYAKLYPNR